MSKSLAGKTALITGSTSGIGLAYAKALAGEGANVVINGFGDADGIEKERLGLEALSGAKALYSGHDLTKVDEIEAMMQEAADAFGGVDILINNAVLMVDISYDNIEAVSLDAWNRAFAVNLNGALLCARAVIPSMRARGGGRIINQTSGGAFPATGLYGISKLALVGLTTTLAKQLGKDNITSNAIAPGNVTSDAGKMLVPDDSPFIQFLQMSCALRPRGEPDELVGTALLLCSDAGRWITGQTIHVDGGWVLRP